MGLFSKSNSKQSNDLNAFLGVGTEYRGKLDFVGAVRIDGTFEGEITTDGDLILGREASIVGTIRVGRLISNGRVEGDVTVKHRTTLEKTASLKGTLSTPKLVVQDGAIIEGRIIMKTGGADAANKVVEGDFGNTPDETGTKPETGIAKTGSDDTNY